MKGRNSCIVPCCRHILALVPSVPSPRLALTYTDLRHLTTGIPSEKRVVRRFRRCVNVIECTYTNLDSIAYYTPSLYGIAYYS